MDHLTPTDFSRLVALANEIKDGFSHHLKESLPIWSFKSETGEFFCLNNWPGSSIFDLYVMIGEDVPFIVCTMLSPCPEGKKPLQWKIVRGNTSSILCLTDVVSRAKDFLSVYSTMES